MSEGAPGAGQGKEAPAAVNPEVRFEHVDADPATIVRWGVGLALITSVVATLLVWFLVILRRHEAAQDPRRPPLYYSTEQRQPEGVRLQKAPFDDLRALREQEERILGTYGWVDQGAGVVHIPIDQAMALYLRRQAAASASVTASAAPLPGLPTDSAPVPSPAAAALPSPSAEPSPAESGPSAAPPSPPVPHGARP